MRWITAIEDAIETSGAVVILVGPHGLGNTQQYERQMALVKQTRNSAFPVIPVLLPGFEGQPSGFLELLTWVDFRGGTKLLAQPERLQALLAALRTGGEISAAQRIATCPYMGLEPFREEDSVFFCGREGLISEIVKQIQSDGFVAVVGRSGSGKSSLVFAGLIPVLRGQRSTTVWDIVSIRPGAWPLHALAEALSSPPTAAGPAARDAFIETEVEALRDGQVDRLDRVIGRRLDAAIEKPDCLLIYVDQWEELYAMAPAADDQPACERHASDREKFISLLVGIAAKLRSRCKVIITVRADFYEQLIRHSLLSGLLPQRQVNIGPLLPVDLQAAIEKPASITGLLFSPPELVGQILQDVGTDEGMLPLLQYALKETWLRREGNHLTADGYTAAGGVRGAIQSTAERTYSSLSAAEKKVTRRLFLGLVRPGDGREDTRARLPIPIDPAIREIIRKFADKRSRLLVTGSENIGPATAAGTGEGASKQRATVEVAHEALIRNWSTLREWLDINRDRLRARSAILESKGDWETAGQNDRALLPEGFQLDRARALVNDPGDVPLEDIKDYIERSVAAVDKRIADERADELEQQRRIAEAERRERQAAEAAAQEAGARELVEASARRAADRAATVLRRWLVVAVIAGVAAIGASMFAAVAKRAAGINLQAAFLTNAEQSLIEQKPTTAHLLASSGITKDTAIWGVDGLIGRFVDVARTHDQIIRLQSIVGLTRAAHLEPLRSWHLAGVLTSTAISSDGAFVAFGDAGGGVYVEPTSGQDKGFKLVGHKGGRIVSLQFIRSAQKLVSATATEIIVWDIQLQQFQVICTNNTGSITEVTVDPAGDFLAWTSKDGLVSFQNLSSLSSLPVSFPDHRSGIAVAISADGKRIVSAGEEGNVIVRGPFEREALAKMETKHSDIISVALNADGTQVAVASLSGPVEVWQVTSDHQTPVPVSLPADKRWKVRYSPNGKTLAVASWRGTVGLWDTGQLTYAGTVDGHGHRVNDLAFSSNSDRIVTVSESGIGRLWPIGAIQPIFRETSPGDAGENIVGVYNADGTFFASGGKDGITRLYKVRGDGQLLPLCSTRPQPDRIIGISVLSEKNLVATIRLAERDLETVDVLSFWSANNCQPVSQFRDQDREFIQGISYDAHNAVLAWGDAEGRIALSSLANGNDRSWMPPKPGKALHSKSIADLAFSPDGRLLASAGNDNVLAIWNMQKRELDHRKAGPAARLNTVQFSPNGKFLAAGGDDKLIFVWDLVSPQPIQVLPFPGGTNRLAFSPDSSMLAAGSDSRQVAVWSTADWAKIFQLDKLVGVRSVYGFHPTRNDLAFDGENGVVRVIRGESLRPNSRQDDAERTSTGTEIDFDAGRDHTELGTSRREMKAVRGSCS